MCFDLTQGDLLFNIVKDHEKVFALLRIIGICVGHSDNSTIIFHNDGGELEGDAQFSTQYNEEIEFLREGKDNSSGFCISRKGGNRRLFYARLWKVLMVPVNDIV